MTAPAPSSVAQVTLERLSARGVASSAELQAALAASQPTVSRALRRLGAAVGTVGQGRQRRYVALRVLAGHAPQQPLRFIGESGESIDWGTLSFVAGGRIQVEGPGFSGDASTELPWFLAPLRPEGYLGRAMARASSGSLPDNPEGWTVDQALDAVLRLAPDMPGAFEIGEPVGELLPMVADDPDHRVKQFDEGVDQTKPNAMGSSAGGEQPKFMAHVNNYPLPTQPTPGYARLIVKFTPPRRTPFGERWHDLLHAEALALQTLAAHGHPAAQTTVQHSERRTYLESVRFDRVGLVGKRHIVPLRAVHRAFVAGPQINWVVTAQALNQSGRLTAADAQRVQTWLWFGRLIGNNDMHFGNLSLQVHLNADGRFAHQMSLAPCYDMLPMRWRPSEAAADMSYGMLQLDPPTLHELQHPAWADAQRMAVAFWQALSAHSEVSADMRQTAAQMAERVEQLHKSGSP